MKKLKLGIDFDDVMVKTHREFIKFIYNKVGDIKKVSKIKIPKGTRYNDTVKIEGDKNNEMIEKLTFEYFSTNFEMIPIMDNAEYVLGKLSEKYELWIVSSRPVTSREFINKMIDSSPIFQKIFDKNKIILQLTEMTKESLLKFKYNKGKVCSEYGIDILIDDYYENVYDAMNYGVKAVKFGEKKYPWDRAIDIKEIEKKCLNNKLFIGVAYNWISVLNML